MSNPGTTTVTTVACAGISTGVGDVNGSSTGDQPGATRELHNVAAVRVLMRG
jgi:hypothetical protein